MCTHLPAPSGFVCWGFNSFRTCEIILRIGVTEGSFILSTCGNLLRLCSWYKISFYKWPIDVWKESELSVKYKLRYVF